MLDFYEKRKLRGIVYSKVTVAVVFLFGIFLSTSVYERYKAEALSAQKREARAEELHPQASTRAQALRGDRAPHVGQRERVLEAPLERHGPQVHQPAGRDLPVRRSKIAPLPAFQLFPPSSGNA